MRLSRRALYPALAMLAACGAPPAAPLVGPEPVAQSPGSTPTPSEPAPTVTTSASAAAPPPERLLERVSPPDPRITMAEAMREPTRRRAMRAMLAAEPGATAWTRNFCAWGRGVVAPLKTLRRGDATWEVDSCCKPHECDTDGICVVFADGGKRAFAWQRVGERVVLLGHPDPEEKAILEEACGKAP